MLMMMNQKKNNIIMFKDLHYCQDGWHHSNIFGCTTEYGDTTRYVEKFLQISLVGGHACRCYPTSNSFFRFKSFQYIFVLRSLSPLFFFKVGNFELVKLLCCSFTNYELPIEKQRMGNFELSL